MSERREGAATTQPAQNTTAAPASLALRAIHIARVLLLREAELHGNRAAWHAVAMAAWNLETQAQLLARKPAKTAFLGAGHETTPTAPKKPRYAPFEGLIAEISANGGRA